VRIGLRRHGEVEIVSGLTVDEYIVIHGTLRVRPGQPVAVIAVAEGDETLSELLSRKEGGAGR
jgi:membrane fusion protein (multidrug efflux system)